MFNALTGVFGGNKTNHHIDNDKKPKLTLEQEQLKKTLTIQVTNIVKQGFEVKALKEESKALKEQRKQNDEELKKIDERAVQREERAIKKRRNHHQGIFSHLLRVYWLRSTKKTERGRRDQRETFGLHFF